MKSKSILKGLSKFLLLTLALTLTGMDTLRVRADENTQAAAAVESTAVTNLLINPGFETGKPDGSYAANWSPWNNPDGNTSQSWDGTTYYQGTKSIKMTAIKSSSAGANQAVTVQPNGYYKLGIWIKTSGATGGPNGRIRYKYDKDQTAWQFTDTATSADWSYVEKIVQVPAEATKLTFENYMTGTGSVWFDEASITKYIPLTAIAFQSAKLQMEVGEISEPSLTYTPVDATNKNVTYESSNPSIVKVEDGKLYALKNGGAIIKAIPQDTIGGAAVQELFVVVGEEIPAAGLTLDNTSIQIEQDQEIQLNPIFEPEDATNKKVNWSSSDNSIASVAAGVVKGISPGKAVITASTEDGSLSAFCEVIVVIKNIVPNGNFEATRLNNGVTQPASWGLWNPSSVTTVAWSSDNTIKHSGDYSGKLTASADVRGGYTQNIPAVPGKIYKFSAYVKTSQVAKTTGATVRICFWDTAGKDVISPIYLSPNALNGDTDWTLMEKVITIPAGTARVGYQCYFGPSTGTAWYDDVKVVEYIPVTDINLDSSYGIIKVGQSITVNAEVLPSDASNPKVTWKSDNPAVASVNNGVIQGITEGFTYITATTEDGNLSEKVLVSVTNSSEIAPIAPKSFNETINEDNSVRGIFPTSDENGNSLTYYTLNSPQNGVLRLTAAGEWEYFPNPNYSGTESFSAAVLNTKGGIAVYDVTINIMPISDEPVVKQTFLSIIEGNSALGKLSVTSADNDTFVYEIRETAANGTTVITGEGNFTYNPNAGFTGRDSFVVKVSGSNGSYTVSKVDIYVAPSGERVLSDLKEKSVNKQHPRLYADSNTLDNLKQLLENNDTYITRWFTNVKGNADSILTQPPKEYEIPDGLRLLEVSREVLSRATSLGMAYKLTGDTKYAERLWVELDKAGNFADWNAQRHFLDVGEMTNAFAIAYDWLYDYWTPEQKAFIVKAIKEKGLLAGVDAYTKTKPSWITVYHNWNSVCNGGLAIGALAVGDEVEIDPQIEGIAEIVLENAIKGLPYMLKEYAPDGGWSEGPGYWDYGTSYAVYMMSSLKQSLGKDYELSDFPGLDITTNFPIFAAGAKGNFNFADAGTGIIKSPVMLWFGTRYNNPSYYWAHRTAASDTASPLAMLWYPGLDKYTAEAPPQVYDKKFGHVEAVTMHGSFYDTMGTFLGFKGGYNQFNHGDLDEGSFVYDAYGVRWALDIGSGDYNSPDYFNMSETGGRWKYYRKRAEGHNTFVLNPGNYPDQNVKATSKIERFETNSNGTAALAVADLIETYSKDAFSAKRGVSFTNNKTTVLVQDEVMNRLPADYWWFMHTEANIDISADGKTAILSQQGKRLYVQILSEQGTFLQMDAASLPTSPVEAQQSNAGIRKLVIHLEDVLDVNVAVRMVPLMENDDIPQDKPAVVKLSDWKLNEETKLTIDNIMIDGKTVEDFNSDKRVYKVVLPYGSTSVPEITASANNQDISLTITKPAGVPGTAKIQVTSRSNPEIKSAYYVELVADNGIRASTAEEGNWPENSMDGNLSTRWAAEGNQWIQYYIGEDYVVDSISIAFFRGNERKYKFDVLVSMDGEDWDTVLQGIETTGTTSDLVKYDFSSFKRAKFVRILGHGSNANRWNNVAEVNIHKMSLMDIDKSAPEITLNGSLTINQTQQSELTFDFSDDLSGVKNTKVTLDGTEADKEITIQPITLSVGNHVLAVEAEDMAGNKVIKTYELKVVINPGDMDECIELGYNKSNIDNEGVYNSLMNKLHYTIAETGSSSYSEEEAKNIVNSLNALKNEVNVQYGKHINADFAQMVLDDIEYLLKAFN